MAYLGNTPQTQSFTPAIDYFNGTGATTAFTLSRPVASVAQVQVVIENVPQNPSSAYTVSGQTITFTSAPPSGTNNIYVEYTSPITQYNALSQSPSIVGDITTSGGHYAVGSFNSAYTDGTVIDYTSGLGRISVGASDGLAFYRGGVANTESMRIDSSGNVGIGTSSPSYKLEVVAGDINVSADSHYRIGSGTDRYIQYRSANADILYSFSPGNFYRQDITNSAHTFFTGNTERMRIDSSGNVQLSTAGTSILNSSGRKILNQTGSVLQVVYASTSTQVTSSSAFYVDTGLSATITPSSTSSTILVIFNVAGIFFSATANSYVNMLLARNGTNINNWGYAVGYSSSAIVRGTSSGAEMLDSPSTTSAVTYKTQAVVVGGATVNFQRDSAVNSTMVLMEIAG